MSKSVAVAERPAVWNCLLILFTRLILELGTKDELPLDGTHPLGDLDSSQDKQGSLSLDPSTEAIRAEMTIGKRSTLTMQLPSWSCAEPP